MIVFINELDNLRNEIYLNSKGILDLLEKRRILAGKIGDLKNSEGMSVRNREREIDILKTLPSDAFEESILNILFEFSIHYEEKIHFDWVNYSEEKNGVRYIKYAGKYENLIFLLSKILNPGSVIACHDRMVSGIMALAGHHIIDTIDNPDLIIKLNTDLNQDIMINNDIMLISEKFMENKKQIYNVAIE